MSCTQITAGQLTCLPAFPSSRVFPFDKASLCTLSYLRRKIDRVSRQHSVAPSRYRRAAVVCLFGGKGKSDDGAEASPWKSLEKSMGAFKKDQSIEDVLKQQIQNQEYFGGGGSGGSSGGGGGGGDSGGFGESGDEGPSGVFDEFTQVFLAIVGFVFLYIYIIEGEEINAIVKDTLKFLFTRQMSIRLRRLINQWKTTFRRMRDRPVYDPYWLEREIINTPTLYDHPAKYWLLAKKLESTLDGVNDDDDDGGGGGNEDYGGGNDDYEY